MHLRRTKDRRKEKVASSKIWLYSCVELNSLLLVYFSFHVLNCNSMIETCIKNHTFVYNMHLFWNFHLHIQFLNITFHSTIIYILNYHKRQLGSSLQNVLENIYLVELSLLKKQVQMFVSVRIVWWSHSRIFFKNAAKVRTIAVRSLYEYLQIFYHHHHHHLCYPAPSSIILPDQPRACCRILDTYIINDILVFSLTLWLVSVLWP